MGGSMLRLRQKSSSFAHRVATLGLLVYIDLWVLEGAFRKWVPGTGTVFYLARDALIIVVLLVLLLSRKMASRSTSWFWFSALFLFVFGVLQTLFGIVDAPVMMVGLRSYLAPVLPLVVLCLQPSVISSSLGKRIIAYLPLQLVLAVIQVSVPASSVWNAQVNGEVTQFTNLGIARTTGTFSSPLGYQEYVLLSLAIAVAFLAERQVAVWWGVLTTGSAILCVVLSGARGAVFGAAAILVALLLANVARGNLRSLGIAIGVLVMIVLGVIVAQSVFPDVVAAFTYRFESASMSEDTSSRLWNTFAGFAGRIQSVFGVGMGANSQAGIALGSTEPWIEADAERWVSELGMVGLILAFGVKSMGIGLVGRLIARSPIVSIRWALLIGYIAPVLLAGQITVSPSSQAAMGVAIVLLAQVSGSWSISGIPAEGRRQLTASGEKHAR